MGLQLLAAPASQPVSLEVAKEHLRIAPDDTDLDAEVGRLIRSATARAEKITQRALAVQSWRLILDKFPRGAISIPLPPLKSVEAIAYTDAAGVDQVLDESAYVVNPFGLIGQVTPAMSKCWPVTAPQAMALRIDFTAGYDAVPEDIVAAILLLVGHLDQNREAATTGTLSVVPLGVDALLSSHCIPSLP
jgi:uncharacterized phiE125 gp8 family phage protein